MIKVGIAGATGYSGQELIDILLKHPDVKITGIFSRSEKPFNVADMFPKFKGRISLISSQPNAKEMAAKCDLIFLALPHTVSMEVVPKLLSAGKKVIDLSADYRLHDTKIYEEFYNTRHKDKTNLAKAVYGLPELYRAKIKNAKLVANPGCYPTAAILALAPLVSLGLADPGSIIIDAKSGVTGAGKKMAEGFLFSEVNEDFKAYKVGIHQHTPEINQELSKLEGKKINVTFVPHLLPLSRGILETIYVRKNQKSKIKNQDLTALYKKFYKNEPFVRIKDKGNFPGIKDVAYTNSCDIGIRDNGDSVIIIAAIDNLKKGASGQAVENMNIMYNFPEEMALL